MDRKSKIPPSYLDHLPTDVLMLILTHVSIKSMLMKFDSILWVAKTRHSKALKT